MMGSERLAIGQKAGNSKIGSSETSGEEACVPMRVSEMREDPPVTL